MKYKQYVFVAALLSSCSVMVKAPLTRFESPETRGKSLSAEVMGGYQGRTDVMLTRDYTQFAPDMNQPIISDDPGHRVMASGYVGILEKLDAGISIPDARFGVKYQIHGEGKEKAAQGNLPISIVAGVSKRSEEESGVGLFSSRSVTYKLRETQADTGLSFGYRVKDSTMIYSGFYFLWDQLKTTYANPTGSAEIQNSGIMKVYNANLGVQQEVNHIFFRFEISISETSLGSKKELAGTYGIASGAFF
jgi:hypothetical protein